MRSLVTRIDRLEVQATPAVLGRFIYTRGPECSVDVLNAFLAQQGINLGKTDLVFHDTPADPGISGTVSPDEPLSLVGVDAITRRIEDLIAELD